LRRKKMSSTTPSQREGKRAEAQRTNQAIIRSFPGRVLTVTVLASHTHKRALSFDSCLPAEACEKAAASKRARLLDDDEQQRDTDAAAHNAQGSEAVHAPVQQHQSPDARAPVRDQGGGGIFGCAASSPTSPLALAWLGPEQLQRPRLDAGIACV
jgi:hypothetical protein